MRILTLGSVAAALTLVLSSPALAQLEGVVTEDGNIHVSVDGNGNNDPGGGVLDVDKPNDSATVRSAYLSAASNFHRVINDNDITLDGQPVAWDQTAFNNSGSNTDFFHNVWADVTSIVKPLVDAAPAGIVPVPVNEHPAADSDEIDGTVLVVIFDDPDADSASGVVLLFGGQATTGDQFLISLAAPLDLSDPDTTADMGLGISFGYQGDSGTAMISEIDVNGNRITSSAGGEDDGGGFNGGLITVGGLGDSNENPADPFAGSSSWGTDDELYTLLPYVQDGDTQIVVDTLNPSDDDNIFFGYFITSVPISLAEETIFLTPVEKDMNLGCGVQLTATVTDAVTNTPIAGRDVDFECVAGPRMGTTFQDTTNALGQAHFDYVVWSNGAEGDDEWVATMIDGNGDVAPSNSAFVYWNALLAQPYCFGVNCPCSNDIADAGCENSTGMGGLLTASGTGSLSADDLIIDATSLPTNRFGFFLVGQNETSLPFGNGFRCVASGATAFPIMVQNTGATGTMQLGPGIAGMAGILQCESWNFQAVFRDDPTGQCLSGFNTTNAIKVTFGD